MLFYIFLVKNEYFTKIDSKTGKPYNVYIIL